MKLNMNNPVTRLLVWITYRLLGEPPTNRPAPEARITYYGTPSRREGENR